MMEYYVEVHSPEEGRTFLEYCAREFGADNEDDWADEDFSKFPYMRPTTFGGRVLVDGYNEHHTGLIRDNVRQYSEWAELVGVAPAPDFEVSDDFDLLMD